MNSFDQNHDESQFDDNLLRSIETLLDDKTSLPQENSIGDVKKFNEFAYGEGDIPKYRNVDHDAFAFGEQVYQKWSTTESNELDAISRQHHFHQKSGLNYGKPPQFIRPTKRNPMVAPTFPSPSIQPDPQILQYQAMLAEKANQILNQYLRLNYEFLNAQATVLGIPLEEYVRNLLIATTNQSISMPLQMPLNFPNMISSNSSFQRSPQPQRKFNRSPFNKKNTN